MFNYYYRDLVKEVKMGKFIEVQVVVRDGNKYLQTHDAILNTEDICMCTPYASGTLIALRSTGNTVEPLELEDRYEDIRYKLFTD